MPVDNDEEMFTVRCGVTMAFYLHVMADSPDEAEEKARQYVAEHRDNIEGEACYFHETYEVEEN